MQLVVDVGNTETVVGLAPSTTEITAHWRVSSGVPRTADEMTALIRAFLAGGVVDETEIVRGVVGSVVPSVNRVWSKTIRAITGAEVVAVGPGSDLPIRLDVEEPLSVGADRIVNTLAASELYDRDTIAVDLGTATTFDCISGDGVFLGGVISPGLPAGLDWLAARTAKLPRVELGCPGGGVINRHSAASVGNSFDCRHSYVAKRRSGLCHEPTSSRRTAAPAIRHLITPWTSSRTQRS